MTETVATGLAGLTAAVKQNVVKVEVLQDPSEHSHDATIFSKVIDTECSLPQTETTPIEIHLNKAVLRITNDIGPRLLSLWSLEAKSACNKNIVKRLHFRHLAIGCRKYFLGTPQSQGLTLISVD